MVAGLMLLAHTAPAAEPVSLYYPLDEGNGVTLHDSGAAHRNGSTNADANGQVTGANINVQDADTWIPVLAPEGIQCKGIVAGSERLLAGGERPIVVDRDRDYVIDYAKGLIKAQPGGKMEPGLDYSMDFRYANPGPQRVPGKKGRALQLDGIDDCLRLGDAPALRKTNQITLQVWVLLSGIVDGTVLAKYTDDNPKPVYGLRLRKAVPEFFYGAAPGKCLAATQALEKDRWNLLTATYDGKVATLYVNGQPVAHQEAAGSLDADGNFYAGGIRDPDFLAATIDEITICNKALPAEEIALAAQ